jgi:hypothetical protein
MSDVHYFRCPFDRRHLYRVAGGIVEHYFDNATPGTWTPSVSHSEVELDQAYGHMVPITVADLPESAR